MPNIIYVPARTPLLVVMYWTLIGFWLVPGLWLVYGMYLLIKYSVIFLFYWMPIGVYRVYAFLFGLIIRK